jgi:hypothetical protein
VIATDTAGALDLSGIAVIYSDLSVENVSQPITISSESLQAVNGKRSVQNSAAIKISLYNIENQVDISFSNVTNLPDLFHKTDLEIPTICGSLLIRLST